MRSHAVIALTLLTPIFAAVTPWSCPGGRSAFVNEIAYGSNVALGRAVEIVEVVGANLDPKLVQVSERLTSLLSLLPRFANIYPLTPSLLQVLAISPTGLVTSSTPLSACLNHSSHGDGANIWICDAENTAVDLGPLATGGGGVAIVSRVEVIHYVMLGPAVGQPILFGATPCIIPAAALGGAASVDGGLSLQFIKATLASPAAAMIDVATGLANVDAGAWESGLGYTFGGLNNGAAAGTKAEFAEPLLLGTVLPPTPITLGDPLSILGGLQGDGVSTDCELGAVSAWSACSSDTCSSLTGTQLRWRVVTVPNALTGMACETLGQRAEERACTALTAPPCSSCANGVLDVGESDVDCGSHSSGCMLCGAGRSCSADADCKETLACLPSGRCLPRTFSSALQILYINVSLIGLDTGAIDENAATALAATIASLASMTSAAPPGGISTANASLAALYFVRAPRSSLRARALSVTGDSMILTLALALGGSEAQATALAAALGPRAIAQLPLLLGETMRTSAPLVAAAAEPNVVSLPLIVTPPAPGGGIIILPPIDPLAPTPSIAPSSSPTASPTPVVPLAAAASSISTGGYIGIGVGAGLVCVAMLAAFLLRDHLQDQSDAFDTRASNNRLSRERRLADPSTDAFSRPPTAGTEDDALAEVFFTAPSGLTKAEFVAQHRRATSDIGSSAPSESTLMPQAGTRAQVQTQAQLVAKSPSPDEVSSGDGVPASPATMATTPASSLPEVVAAEPRAPESVASPDPLLSPVPPLTAAAVVTSPEVPVGDSDSPPPLPVAGQTEAESALALPALEVPVGNFDATAAASSSAPAASLAAATSAAEAAASPRSAAAAASPPLPVGGQTEAESALESLRGKKK